MTDEQHPRTLYVGNLDASVNEELICTLFAQMGPVKGCKIIRDTGNDPYAFVEFQSHQSAATALAAMNKRLFLEKEMKVNWATSPGNQPKTDTSQHHHIFVGDLSPEIETETLKEAFAPFGEISNCRIVRDPQTLKSKGYAFVSFVKKPEAENAIQAMNGQWLGSRAIRTNWSTRKPPPPREAITSRRLGGGITGKTADYEDIFNKTSATNTTVYCGGFQPNFITDDIIHKHFGQFGTIQDIRVFKDKGYAFIKFTSKESAAHAIEGTNNSDVYGHSVKCFWGKENGGDMSGTSAAGWHSLENSNNISTIQGPGIIMQPSHTPANNHSQQMPQQGGAQYPYTYQQMGYWYPQSYPAQMTQQYMQPGYTTTYPAAYQYAQQQQGAAAGYRMMQPAANMAAAAQWGMPTVATNGATAATQPTMMYAAAMPQFQTQ